jgi:hypothetical protein
VIVKREHFREMREAILKMHPEYSCFDEFFVAFIHRGTGGKLSSLCQFCLLMDYAFETHRDEYDWHFETYEAIESILSGEMFEPEMFKPVPRVAIHASYMFRGKKTVAGRRRVVSNKMREGYCYSLPSWNASDLTTRRCGQYHINENVYDGGQWKFEGQLSSWTRNMTEVRAAHAKRMDLNVEHLWDENELKRLFSNDGTF